MEEWILRVKNFSIISIMNGTERMSISQKYILLMIGVNDNGRDNLGKWIEAAAKNAGK